jgi:hypothetical protein
MKIAYIGDDGAVEGDVKPKPPIATLNDYFNCPA